MQEAVGVGRHPERGRPDADETLDVDAGDRHPEAVPLVREQDRVRRVAVEGRREVEQRDADVVHLAAVDLRRVGVAELVDPADDRQDQEELEDVEQRLAEERVELVGALEDRREVLREDPDRPDRAGGPDRHDGRRPDPADVAHGLVQEVVGIDDPELDEERVEPLRLRLRRAPARRLHLREEREVALGRRLIEQVELAEHLVVLEDERQVDLGARLGRVLVRDLGRRASAVEEGDDAPLALAEVEVRLVLRDS